MDLNHLRSFRAICEELNITRAAQRLHIAQPTLSKHLHALEEALSVQLVERNTRRLQLTEAGRQLQYRAAQLLELEESTRRELAEYSAGMRGVLRIGSIASAMDILFPQKILEYSRLYPEVRFQIRECNTHEILDLLDGGLVDIGIVRTPVEMEHYDAILLPDEPMVAATAGEPFWEAEEAAITAARLEHLPLLVHNRYVPVITELCRRAGFEPNILCQVDETRSLLHWANAGIGVAVVQQDWMSLMDTPRLKYKVLDEPLLVTRTAVIWDKRRQLPAAARRFLETLGF